MGQKIRREMVTQSVLKTVVLSLNTNIYATGETLAETQEVTDALRTVNGCGIIQSIVVQDDDDQAGALDLVFFDANTSLGTENSAVSMADNDTILGIVSIAAADYADMINSRVATKANVGIGIKAALDSTSIYMGAVSRDAKTYTASGISVRLFILQE